MRLADFIEKETAAIVAEAVAFARTLAVLSGTEESFIRNHLPEVLRAIAADLRTAQSEQASIEKSHGQSPTAAIYSEADGHGLQRARAGLSIEQVLAEYRALRASVLRLWGARSMAAKEDTADINRFNEAIDQAIAESVRTYAAETERRRQLFLAALGHDLRGPLNAVLLASEAIRHRGPPELGPFTDILARSVARTSRLLESLLEYNLVGLGIRMKLHRSSVDLGRECAEEVEILRAANPGVSIELDIVGDCRGGFDESRVREALSNLVTNAVRHGVRSRPIQVALRGSHDAVNLMVTNGIGARIPASELPLLFQPMRRRADTPTGGERTSLGLGLFIAKEITEAHAGSIDAICLDSAITFTMVLPKGPLAPPDAP